MEDNGTTIAELRDALAPWYDFRAALQPVISGCAIWLSLGFPISVPAWQWRLNEVFMQNHKLSTGKQTLVRLLKNLFHAKRNYLCILVSW